MNDDFRALISVEIKQRGWSQREFARQSNISHPLISQVLAGDIPPSADFCIKAALALELSPVLLLVKAGILPPQEPLADDRITQETIEIVRNLPSSKRKQALDFVRWLYQNKGE